MVKPARPSQRRIQRIRPVRRADDDDRLFARSEVVHTRQELRDDTAFHFSLRVFTFGCDGVDFVEEEDTRRDFLRGRVSGAGHRGADTLYLGFVECIPQRLLRLARHAGDYGGRGHGDEGQLDLLHMAVSVSVSGTKPTHPRQAPDELGLAAAGHAVEEDALGPGDAGVEVDLRVEEGEGGDFEQLGDLRLQPAEGAEVERGGRVLCGDHRGVRPRSLPPRRRGRRLRILRGGRGGQRGVCRGGVIEGERPPCPFLLGRGVRVPGCGDARIEGGKPAHRVCPAPSFVFARNNFSTSPPSTATITYVNNASRGTAHLKSSQPPRMSCGRHRPFYFSSSLPTTQHIHGNTSQEQCRESRSMTRSSTSRAKRQRKKTLNRWLLSWWPNSRYVATVLDRVCHGATLKEKIKTLGRGYLCARHQETFRRRFPHCRSSSVYSQEDSMHYQGH